MAGTPFPSNWQKTPTAVSAWGGMTPANQQIYNLLSQQSNDGMIANHNANVQNAVNQHLSRGGTFGQPLPPKQATPVSPQPPAAGNQPAAASSNPMAYQSGINVGGGIGKQGLLSGLLSTGKQSNASVSAFTRGTAMNDYAQIGRGIDAQNQDIRMQQQAKRSESTTEGATNLAKVAQDYAERGISQIGLAAQIASNNIGFAGGLWKAGNGWLGGSMPTNPGYK
jgi:hypothetical protein